MTCNPGFVPAVNRHTCAGKSEEQFPKDTVGRLLADCWLSVGRLLANSQPTDSGPTVAD